MKELSNYYKMEKISLPELEKEPPKQSAKPQYQNTEDEGIERIVRSLNPMVTPFNYEPYLRQSGSRTMRYDTILADELKTPDTNYNK